MVKAFNYRFEVCWRLHFLARLFVICLIEQTISMRGRCLRVYKDFIRSAFRLVGLDVRRYTPTNTYDRQLALIFGRHQIDLVFDVGANTGQFARYLRHRVGYKGRIVSVEPMAAAHARLCYAKNGDPLWEIAPRAAVGTEIGSIVLHVAENSVSSSVLPMLDSHASVAPESRYVREELVPLTTLDTMACGYVKTESAIFVKIDTQGYEGEVLRGGCNTLAHAIGVQLELSLVPLYAGQKLMPELVQWMSDLGFDMWAVSPVFVDPETGRLLQVDAVFVKRSDIRRKSERYEAI
jgi:FkbM family methyltransferase